MRKLLLFSAVSLLLACKGKALSFDGARLEGDTRPIELKPDEKKFEVAVPRGKAPFAITETKKGNYALGEGLMVAVWHETGDGDAADVRAAIEKGKQRGQTGTSIAMTAPDEVVETASYVKVRGHTSLPGGLGNTELFLYAKAQDGKLHRWTVNCTDILQDARCKKVFESLQVEQPTDFTAP